MRRKDREVTAIDDIRAILDSCKTASIAMIDNDIPYVLPLSYGYEFKGESLILYFRSAAEGRKIDVLKANNKVCFSIFSEGKPVYAEIPCNSGYYYSSVIGNGTAKFIEDISEKKYALQKMFEHQSGRRVEFSDEQAETVCVFEVISNVYMGKRKPES